MNMTKSDYLRIQLDLARIEASHGFIPAKEKITYLEKSISDLEYAKAALAVHQQKCHEAYLKSMQDQMYYMFPGLMAK